MQTKDYNAYRITHKNGSIEDVNALNLVQALENMETTEEESKVIQAFLVKEDVRTLLEDEAKEILFTAVVAEDGGGSIATPTQGKVHVGDQVNFTAIPARNYEFVSWKLNGEVFSTEASTVVTFPELKEGFDTAVFTATFKLSDVAWTTRVEPTEASTAGCVAFPTAGTTQANTQQELLAVEKVTSYLDTVFTSQNDIDVPSSSTEEPTSIVLTLDKNVSEYDADNILFTILYNGDASGSYDGYEAETYTFTYNNLKEGVRLYAYGGGSAYVMYKAEDDGKNKLTLKVSDFVFQMNRPSTITINTEIKALIVPEKLAGASVLTNDNELVEQAVSLATIWQKGQDPLDVETGVRWSEAMLEEINVIQLMDDITKAVQAVTPSVDVVFSTVTSDNGNQYLKYTLQAKV